MSPRPTFYLGLLVIALCGAAAATEGAVATPPEAPRSPAIHLEQGAVARDTMVAVGRDLAIDGRALADVAALDGSVAITGEVIGDVVVLGGGARLAPTARVGGDLFVLGGELALAPGAQVAGRLGAYPTFSRAWLTLLEGPAVGLSATAPLVLGAKLALAAAWLALVLLLFATSAPAVVATSQQIATAPFRCFWFGLVAVATMALTALFVNALATRLLGLPLLVLLALFALLLKLWGMVALCHAFGSWLARRALPRRRRLALHLAVAGCTLLSLVKLVPYLGVWLWTMASLIAIGATLASKFGRREPWFAMPQAEASLAR